MSSGEGSGQQGQNNGGGPQQTGGGDMAGGQQQQSQGGNQQGQNVNQQHQQQLQLQQSTTAQQNAQAQNQMQQLQVIQQPLQNHPYLQQLYNPQGQLLMPGNILHHQLNPQIQPAQMAPSIQVITGKSFQPNQLGSPMLTTSAGYATIPTSAANNQAYIIGQLINSSQPSILQQHSQPGKPGEMQKVIQPQQITQTQLPQGLTWAAPHTFLQNPIFIRGTQPDQMFIQQQQPLQSNAGSHQQFTMPLTAGQLPTSISSSANGLQQVTQQQNQGQGNQPNQGQQQQNQSQNQQQIQSGNVLSMKTPANLQPKPPLQIQPSPGNQQQVQHQQQQLQQQQITMGGQFHMIPQPTSQANVLSQQILTQSPQTITTQVMHPNQPQQLQQQRHLTILPQQTSSQSLQPQQVTFIQQQPQQHQPIRPNLSYTVTATSTTQPTSQSQGVTATPIPQQRPKIRKPNPGRGGANNSNAGSPNQQAKVMYPRSNMPASGSPAPTQSKLAPSNQTPSGATLTRISSPGLQPQQQQPVPQPLKTINISALHTPPTLPDATLTPLNPQSNSQVTSAPVQPPPQSVHMFATTPQLPTPNVSITPTAPPPKKDEPAADPPPETKGETEKENTKSSSQSNQQDVEENKSKLPKAMVKPQVLTHVIEGFVIQEASEPFPMGKNGESDEPPKKKAALSGEMGKCEMCGKVDLKTKFKKNKRFCTSACAKSMKAQQNQQQYQQQQQQTVNNSVNNPPEAPKSKSKRKWGEGGDAESTDETSSSMGDMSVMSPTTTEHIEEETKMNPVKWNVQEVVDFVRSLPGCSEYADDFSIQEIDGQALMLLKEDHLMSAMGMKLGPALKLCAKIESLRAINNAGNPEQNSGKQ